VPIIETGIALQYPYLPQFPGLYSNGGAMDSSEAFNFSISQGFARTGYEYLGNFG